MKKLTIVFSAPSMIRLINLPFFKDDAFRNLAVDCISECIEKVRADVKEIMGVDIGIDILYNAFTEPDNGKFLRDNRLFGFDRLHADSGGLQVLTLGKEMNRDLMNTVYENQSYADIAMAFDEIPARDHKTNNRASIATRMYHPDLAEQCALTTAKNIGAQAEYFNTHNATANVMFITQGNSGADVIKWWNTGYPIIDKELWRDRVCGIAMGGGCMGTGEAETIENLLSWMIIHDQWHTHVTKNLVHLLGYGSAGRLAPAVAMFRSKAFPEDIELSFDSSSLSMKYMMGGSLNEDGGSNSTTDPRAAEQEFRAVLHYFAKIFQKYLGDFEFEEVLAHLVETRKSIAQTQAVDVPNFVNIKYDIARVFIPAYIVYQSLNLFRSINKAIKKSPLLKMIEGHDNMHALRRFYGNNQHRFTSKRVYRYNTDIQEFFA